MKINRISSKDRYLLEYLLDKSICLAKYLVAVSNRTQRFASKYAKVFMRNYLLEELEKVNTLPEAHFPLLRQYTDKASRNEIDEKI